MATMNYDQRHDLMDRFKVVMAGVDEDAVNSFKLPKMLEAQEPLRAHLELTGSFGRVSTDVDIPAEGALREQLEQRLARIRERRSAAEAALVRIAAAVGELEALYLPREQDAVTR